MLHNIEKSAFRKGAYVGYGKGLVWQIKKDGRHWVAQANGNWFIAKTLTALSAQISN